jgi:hypothetical protein
MRGAPPIALLISLGLFSASLVFAAGASPRPNASNAPWIPQEVPSEAAASAPVAPAAPKEPQAGPSDAPTNRAPGSLDTQNIYHSNGVGYQLQGTPGSKEPVIDGKNIPSVIDFSGHRTNLGGVVPHAKAKVKPAKPAKPPASRPKPAEKEEPSEDGL